MRRAIPLIAFALVLHAQSAEALLVRGMSDFMPAPGHVDAKFLGVYTPYELTIRNGTPYSFNPTTEGYHRLAADTTLEIGIAPDTSFFLTLPLGLTQHFPPSPPATGTTPLLTGVGNIGVGIASRAVSHDGFTWKSRAHAMVPTGSTSLGGSVSGLGLDQIFTWSLLRSAVVMTLNANYLYRLRATQVDPTTNLFTHSWQGQHAEVNAGIEWRALRGFSVGVEALSHWDSPMEENRQGVPETGSTFVGLAPGFSLDVGPQVTWLGSLTVPMQRGGYQPSFRLEGATGVLLRF